MTLRAWVLGALFLQTTLALADTSKNIDKEWAEIPERGTFYLFMNKAKSELTVRSLSDSSKIYRRYHAISGTNSGDKIQEGDKKTPEGIYLITRRIPQEQLRKLHGVAAFALNFPNPFDRVMKRGGSGIWIHGVENSSRMAKSFDTLGCVALDNPDVLDLFQHLSAETPVMIVDEEKPEVFTGVEPVGGPIAQRIQQYLTAWNSRDPEAYLAFFHENFLGRGKMTWGQWADYKRRLTKVYKSINVTIEDLRVLRHGKYALAFFKQHYASDRFESHSQKRLYWLGTPEESKIIIEEVARELQSQTLPAAIAADVKKPTTSL